MRTDTPHLTTKPLPLNFCSNYKQIIAICQGKSLHTAKNFQDEQQQIV